jgi:PAS domain-containing protein
VSNVSKANSFVAALYELRAGTSHRGPWRARVSRAWAIALHEELQGTWRASDASIADVPALAALSAIDAEHRAEAERRAQAERAALESAPLGAFVFTLFATPVYLDDSVDGLVVEADPTPGEAQMGRLE